MSGHICGDPNSSCDADCMDKACMEKRIAELEAENESLRTAYSTMDSTVDKVVAENKRLRDALERCLEWYEPMGFMPSKAYIEQALKEQP